MDSTNVIGVLGSPIKDSNSERALRAVLDATGCDYEVIKLVDHRMEPCRACLGCVATGRCVLDDDGTVLAEKVKAADAMVVAGFTPYSTIDGRTKVFLERLYPLRHLHGHMAGKPGGAVITSCVVGESDQLPPAATMGVNAVQFYMMEEGMQWAGAVKVNGNVPCIRCGRDTECRLSGIQMLYGADATVESVGVKRFEEQPKAVAAAKQLGESIAAALAEKAG